MDSAAIQETLRQAVIAATGVEDCEWSDTARGARFGGGPQVDLTLRTPQGVGVDWASGVLDTDTDTLVRTQHGVRRFVLSIAIETDSQAPGEDSLFAVSSRLRTRLRRPAVLKALRAGLVSLVTIQPTNDGTYTAKDGRRVSRAVTDVVFTTVDNDSDETAAGGYIKTARVTANLTNPTKTVAVEGP